MAINTKGSKTDGNGWRVEQYYNPATDSYEAIEGSGGAANMKLIGSIVEEQMLHNAVAVRDTAIRNSIDINLSKYRDFSILVYSTLDQTVQVSVQNTEFNSGSSVEGIGSSSAIKTITGSTFKVHNLTSKEWLQAILINKAAIRIYCATAPTAGSVTVKLIGRL
jgi:hypothetical protein